MDLVFSQLLFSQLLYLYIFWAHFYYSAQIPKSAAEDTFRQPKGDFPKLAPSDIDPEGFFCGAFRALLSWPLEGRLVKGDPFGSWGLVPRFHLRSGDHVLPWLYLRPYFQCVGEKETVHCFFRSNRVFLRYLNTFLGI